MPDPLSMMSRTLGWLTLFLIGTNLFVMSPLLPPITGEFGTAGNPDVNGTAGGEFGSAGR